MIDRLARSLLIQGLPNDIYSLIDSNETAEDLWDALERQIRNSEYCEQDKKAVILYEYKTFKATEGEQLLDTYLCYLQVINDLKNCGYKKDNYVNDALGNKKKAVVVTLDPLALVARKQTKAFNRKKYYAKPTNNNLRTSLTSSSANKKPEYVKLVEKKEDKKADEKKRDMSKVKCYNCKKEGHFSKGCKKAKVKDYNYYNTKMLLAKKDSDEQKCIEKANQQSKDLENQNKDLQEKYDVLINQENTFEEKNNELNEQMKVLKEKNANLLAQTEVLQDQLKVKHVVIDTHTEYQAQYAKLEEERYEYMIRYSALCDNEKQHRKKINEQEILFDKMSRQLVEMNNNVLRLQEKILKKKRTSQNQKDQTSSLKPYIPTVILEKIIIDLEDEVVSLLEKEKENLETNLDTFSSVRRPKHSGVIWKKKGSSNTSNVYLSSVSHSKLNKDVKRYSRKDLLSYNNSHLGETSSAYVCNDAMNVSCNSRLSKSFDENNLFIFDDESVRNSQVSKMPFRKKPNASLNMPSRSKLNKSLPRIVRKWLSKLQPLAEPVDKWILKIVQICLWIIYSGCSKHMTGSCALLTNFVEKFLGTVRFENNDFAVIAGYGDVLKAKGDIGVFVGYSKESVAFRIYNKRTRKIHGSVNVNFDEILEMASKQFSLEPGLANLNETGKSLNPSVSQVLEISKKDLEDLFQRIYDEYFDSSKIMKSSTTNVETSNVEIPSNEEEVFHESFESFQEESSLNDDAHQSLEEVADAYFDTSTSFHDPSNVHTFYQPYTHEKKWTKDYPLHKIIGDPKSSVRTRGQLANSCLFSCLLSSIKLANVAEALRDADWVSAMQEELDQFARLKVWRLVPRPEAKTIIKTKWIFKNKKDESSLVIRNKVRLVAVGYSQQKGINYDKMFAPVAQIKAIRLFLAYAAHKDFTVF
nr:hypothetical protein [Tanacetum cinerariifolium]